MLDALDRHQGLPSPVLRAWSVYDVTDHDADGIALAVGRRPTGDAGRRTRKARGFGRWSLRNRPSAARSGIATAAARRDPALAGPVILDFVKCRIEAFNREQGGGVAVSKDDTVTS